jgi:cytochrome c553
MYPNLKRQKAAYLARQPRAFKSNEWIIPYMEGIDKGLSEQDIVNVAYYYSTLTPQNLKENVDKSMGK